MVKKKKRKTKPRKAKKRKKKSAFQKKWDKLKPQILQRIGAVTVFIVIFVVLFGVLIFQIVQHTNNFTNQQNQEEIAYEQREGFIQSIIPAAQKLQRQYGVLASISIAQAALESNFGTSELGADYNNLYGVKTDESDPDGVNLPTMEFVDGEWIEIIARFKVYPSREASMTEHAELIYYGTSWDAGFYADVLAGDSYTEQARGLQSAGYATDPDYANKLIEIIENWDLQQYDQPVQG